MSNAKPLASHHRVENYANQDRHIHKFIETNCPTYMTPKQIRRVNKKMRSQYKVKAFSAPF